MATLTQNLLGFSELAKRTNGGEMLEIAEVLHAAAPILDDIPYFVTNQILSELIGRRTSLPTGTWRKINSGVVAESSKTQNVVEPVALLEARSVIDEDLVDNAPNPADFRNTEDMSFVEGMAQEWAKTLIRGTTEGAATSDPEEINGFQQRLRDLSQTNVIGGGGSGGDTSSIYVAGWGRRGAYGIVPSAAANRGTLGLAHRDKGKEPVIDSSTNTTAYYAYVSQFKWYVGLAVRDELSIGRYANIEAASGAITNIFNEDKLIELLNLMHLDGTNPVIYLNKTIATQAQIRLKDKGNVAWSQSDGLSGTPILRFMGIPVRKMDNAIVVDTETVVADI